jgi:2-amino-4-hydroxy-6-hydroxymethyldihydropteridine diphosphokinase
MRSRTPRKGTPERSSSKLASEDASTPIPALKYFIALGSNKGDRESSLRTGWSMLSSSCQGMRLSSIYETRPMYVAEQPLYLNAVGEVTSSMAPEQMLRLLQSIEASLGRDRSKEIRMGPRTLDLDILLCGTLVQDTPALIIPHPRMAERMFVLVPLLELSPAIRDPRTGAPYERALAALRATAGNAASEGVYLYQPQ